MLPLSIKTSSAALEKDGFPSPNSKVLLSGADWVESADNNVGVLKGNNFWDLIQVSEWEFPGENGEGKPRDWISSAALMAESPLWMVTSAQRQNKCGGLMDGDIRNALWVCWY